MKRVLFLPNHYITLHCFRKELIERLVEKGHEVYLALPESEENEAFVRMGCRLAPVRMNRHGMNPVSDIALCVQYVRLFRRLRPDVVFSYTIKPNIYGSIAARITHTRIICNITGTGAAFLHENWLSAVVRMLYRHSVKYADLVFFQNESNRRYCRRHGLVDGNDELLPCGSGVNLRAYQPSSMPEDTVTHFLFVGRVMRIKGIDAYLECARRLKAKGIPAMFHIAGFVDEKGYERRLREMHTAGVIDYVGYSREMTARYERCHCVVLPSLGGEGVPNVLLEAAASGRACIASSVPGAWEAVEDGVTGYLCEAGSADALEECMLRFVRLPLADKERMGAAGRTRMENGFDREQVIRRYMKEVEKLSENAGGNVDGQ